MWNMVTKRDGEAIRRVATMMRYFGGIGFLQSPGWVPHTPAVVQGTVVFASEWPLGAETLWTLVNRGPDPLTGAQLRLEARAYTDLSFYDCYKGALLAPSDDGHGILTVEFDLEGAGYGCVVATPNVTRPSDNSGDSDGGKVEPLQRFLAVMKAMTATPLADIPDHWSYLQQHMVPVSPTPPPPSRRGARQGVPGAPIAPIGVVLIPQTNFHFVTAGVEVEGFGGAPGAATGTDVQFPWEPNPTRDHDQQLKVPSFEIAQYPVTCGQYQQYLVATGYTPHRSAHNWLGNWAWGSVAPRMGAQPDLPLGLMKVPVTYISLGEAQGYCVAQGALLVACSIHKPPCCEVGCHFWSFWSFWSFVVLRRCYHRQIYFLRGDLAPGCS